MVFKWLHQPRNSTPPAEDVCVNMLKYNHIKHTVILSFQFYCLGVLDSPKLEFDTDTVR